MKRARRPVFGSAAAAVLLGFALVLVLAGCSLSGMVPSSIPGSSTTTDASRTTQSSGPPTTRTTARPQTTAAASSTSLRPTKTSTTAVHLTSGSAATVARKLKPSVVGVTAVLSQSRTETVEAVGTGVIYSATGLIITANHVITGESTTPAKRLTVTLPSGSVVAATLVGRDPTTDIAVLRVRTRGLHPALFRTDLSGLAPGDFVVALGNVKVLAHPVTSGHVTAFLHDVKYEGLSGVHETIESSAPLAHGNSGGPLVDAEGRVVGLNVAELLGTKTGVTLPADLVIKVVRRLIGAG